MTDIIERAKQLRKKIELASSLMSDEDAWNVPELFPAWSGDGVEYKEGERVRYENKLYKVIQYHISQADWTPDKAVSLFVEVSDPAVEWPDWKQPAGSQDAYQKGDKVTHNEKHWTSDIDNNVWEPSIYGWTEA